MKIGLLFGSFNPVHSGHVHLAEIVLNEIGVDEVWFVISPQNPFKINQNLVDEKLRQKMVYLMTEDNHKLKTCDIEFDLPRPSYTHTTLDALHDKYPDNEFHFIIGSDALNSIQKWKNFEDIIKIPIIAFIRDGEEINTDVRNIINDINIIGSSSHTSSTLVRKLIREGNIETLSKNQLLNKKTIEFINDNKLYI